MFLFVKLNKDIGYFYSHNFFLGLMVHGHFNLVPYHHCLKYINFTDTSSVLHIMHMKREAVKFNSMCLIRIYFSLVVIEKKKKWNSKHLEIVKSLVFEILPTHCNYPSPLPLQQTLPTLTFYCTPNNHSVNLFK